MSLHHFARGAIAAENSRRMMMLRGFTPNGHRLWDQGEAGNLLLGYPDYPSVMLLNIRRTRPAHYGKAGRLGITKPRAREWDPNELFKLHRLYPRATKQELLSALPGRTWTAICRRANADGYFRLKLARPSGIGLIDQILSRAIQRHDSLKDLDRATSGAGYFSRRKWQVRRNHTVEARAVAYLGGTIKVRWVRPPGFSS